ncbi:MAG: preprotein translocase subunit SecG [Acidobacteria bacterium]|nr:MAG: preprotein translocase subunit SecG [Acidobacteriota bacterium]
MVFAVTALQIISSILLVVVVLIQGGENVDMAAAFGGSSQAAFGPRGAVTTLAKITWVLGFIFMATSITMAIWASKGTSSSVMQNAPAQTHTTPVAPAAPARK